MLVARAIGDRLTCIFVNNGVLRKNEFAKVQKTMREQLGLNLVAVDASERFLSQLAGVTDPEQKRKISATNSSRSSTTRPADLRSQKHRRGVAWLVQGTLIPTSSSPPASRARRKPSRATTTSAACRETMKLKLIEPLRDLFKDEVRRIGRDLGMPDDILDRQPFPGPGLAVRILGEVTPERVALLQEADAIVRRRDQARRPLHARYGRSFAVLLPVKSVGVMGDQRTYAYTCAIRAVHSEDGMTADWAPLPYEVLRTISSRIVSEVRGINRVVYDITSKPPGTIEWE